jgi:hypothetical protein
VQGLGGKRPKGTSTSGFDLPHDPASPLRLGPKLVDEHRLAHSPQAGEDQAAFGTSLLDAGDEDLEPTHLVSSARQLGGSTPGAWGVRVEERVHCYEEIDSSMRNLI